MFSGFLHEVNHFGFGSAAWFLSWKISPILFRDGFPCLFPLYNFNDRFLRFTFCYSGCFCDGKYY